MAKLPDVDVAALPHWIDGHAFISCGERYRHICHAKNSQIILRQVSLADEMEVESAIISSANIAASWLERSDRSALILDIAGKIAEQLQSPRYFRHFAKLIEEESLLDKDQSEQKLSDFINDLSSFQPDHTAIYTSEKIYQQEGKVNNLPNNLVIFSASQQPFADFQQILLLINCGFVVIILANLQAATLLLAMCELLARFSCPAGVCNLLYADEQMIEYFTNLGFRNNSIESNK